MCLSFFMSCIDKKNEEVATNEVVEEVVEVNPNSLKIEIDGVFPSDDELIVFWKDATISYFDDANTVYQGIKGGLNSQVVTFEIEEGINPNDIRIDISSTKGAKEIQINSIKIHKQDRSLIISKDQINEYFRFNEFLDTKEPGKFVTKEELGGEQ